MGFVEEECERLAARLREPCSAEIYRQLYAARQALSFALIPTVFRAPLDTILSTQADSADCLENNHPPLS
jgi:hypothetical protein